jgi:hypothetical protein
LVVQQVNKTNPNDFGTWVLSEGQALEQLGTEPGGEFLIAPDSETLLMLQGQGTAIIPLDAATAGEAEQLDFLPEFGRVFDLTSNGTAAAMVDFNQNNPELRFTESLVLVNNQGEVEAAEPIELVTFAPQTQISLSVAPDGLALLVAAAPTASDAAPNADPASPQLWLVPPFQTAQQRLEGIPTATPPEPLPFTGQKPTWLP